MDHQRSLGGTLGAVHPHHEISHRDLGSAANGRERSIVGVKKQEQSVCDVCIGPIHLARYGDMAGANIEAGHRGPRQVETRRVPLGSETTAAMDPGRRVLQQFGRQS